MIYVKQSLLKYVTNYIRHSYLSSIFRLSGYPPFLIRTVDLINCVFFPDQRNNRLHVWILIRSRYFKKKKTGKKTEIVNLRLFFSNKMSYDLMVCILIFAITEDEKGRPFNWWSKVVKKTDRQRDRKKK